MNRRRILFLVVSAFIVVANAATLFAFGANRRVHSDSGLDLIILVACFAAGSLSGVFAARATKRSSVTGIASLVEELVKARGTLERSAAHERQRSGADHRVHA
jgi:hypothetical protein